MSEQKPSFSDLSVEYQIALEDVQRLQPQYDAAVKRYNNARKALQDRLNNADEQLNLI